MAKQAIALRLTPETLIRVDAHAKARGASRQVILEAAVDAWLGLAEGGVPDLPVVDSPVVRQRRAAALGRPSVLPGGDAKDWAAARQVKLNEAKARASR